MKRGYRVWVVVCLFVGISSTNVISSFGQNPGVPEPPSIPEHVQKVMEIEKILARPIDPNMNFGGERLCRKV